MYIVCDANCNNFGNYFIFVGDDRDISENVSSYIANQTYYPKGHCYRAKGLRLRGEIGKDAIRYSEAIDYLIPEDYVRWKKTRFKEV